MSACPQCDVANPVGYRFCGRCGNPLAVVVCRACGASVAELGQRFCGQCGEPLPSTETATAARLALEERKLATVLFADVVGFTSLAERTDPEVVARMVDRALGRLAEIVVEHGGTVDKYMGDALMAVFGVPTAHDNDAERAVAAALAMRALDDDLAFSIGVNSGEVMATTLGRPGQVTVIGDVVNVAARLEKAAGPGEILCGSLTAQLAGRAMLLQRRPALVLKGKRAPVEVWEAVGPIPREMDPVNEMTPLVGRATDLAFLRGQWDAVCRERTGRFVLLCGDAGSGTTRLVSELAGLVSAGGQVVRVRHPAYGALGGARVVADVLRQLGLSSDPEVSARLRSMTGDVDQALRAMDPVALDREQVWALARLLQEKSEEQPLLLVVDDMHRSDERSLDVAAKLVERSGRAAMLVVLVGRSDPGEWLGKFSDATTVRLRPLGTDDAAALARALVGDKPLTAEAVEFLVERSGGNPLYLRELVAVGRSQGSLVDDGVSYSLGDRSVMPASRHALLAARLDGLEPAQKLVFEHIAVLGEGPTATEIEALGAPGAPAALRALLQSGLLRLSADGRYSTPDSLLLEVAYETLPRNARGQLHRLAARVVSRTEERARHLERSAEYLADDGAVVSEAAEALADVGQELLGSARHLDAIRVLERAVALGSRRPSMLLDLARVEAQVGHDGAARRTLDLVADDPLDASVAIERDHFLANTRSFSDPALALSGLREVAQRWADVGNVGKEAWANANVGVVLFNLGRLQESASTLGRALTLFESAGDRSGRVAAAAFLCLVAPTDQRVPGWLDETMEFADAAGDRSMQMSTLTTLAWHHFLRSFWGGPQDTADAEGFALRLTAVAQEIGALDLATQGWSLLAIVARGSGRFDEAAVYVSAIERSVPAGRRSESWLAWAAAFTVTVASGTSGAAPPFPPGTLPDPVAAVAGLVVGAELAFVGRIAEAVARFEGEPRPERWLISHLSGVLYALSLVLAGRNAEARPWADRAARAARLLGAHHVVRASTALLAEIDRDLAGLGPPPQVATGVADVLVLRAHAVNGDLQAARTLNQAVRILALPGLDAGADRPGITNTVSA